MAETANRLAAKLIPWYHTVRRPLPWRINRDPYRIWVSEVMLQQTTVTAVIPFYEKFMKRFPTVTTLANAELSEVIEHWAGLGYYSRARSLHKSAKHLNEIGRFPETHTELLELPGFGPYTARAVSSLAFAEKVGVVDGNVIRVLSRVFDLDLEWWKSKERDRLQAVADDLAQAKIKTKSADPSDVNQALMELGATVCTPKSPTCLLCPWLGDCAARKNETIGLRPKSKPRRESEIWLWEPVLEHRPNQRFLLVENNYAPFLKGHMIWPGKVTQLKKKPKDFDYKGGVTHHEIYVRIARKAQRQRPSKPGWVSPTWISYADLKTKVPSSLVRKAADIALDERTNS